MTSFYMVNDVIQTLVNVMVSHETPYALET